MFDSNDSCAISYIPVAKTEAVEVQCQPYVRITQGRVSPTAEQSAYNQQGITAGRQRNTRVLRRIVGASARVYVCALLRSLRRIITARPLLTQCNNSVPVWIITRQ